MEKLTCSGLYVCFVIVTVIEPADEGDKHNSMDSADNQQHLVHGTSTQNPSDELPGATLDTGLDCYNNYWFTVDMTVVGDWSCYCSMNGEVISGHEK